MIKIRMIGESLKVKTKTGGKRKKTTLVCRKVLCCFDVRPKNLKIPESSLRKSKNPKLEIKKSMNINSPHRIFLNSRIMQEKFLLTKDVDFVKLLLRETTKVFGEDAKLGNSTNLGQAKADLKN